MIGAAVLAIAVGLSASVLAGWGRLVFLVTGIPRPAAPGTVEVWLGVFAVTALAEFLNFLVPIDWKVTFAVALIGAGGLSAGSVAPLLSLHRAAAGARRYPLASVLLAAAFAALCLRALSAPVIYDAGLYYLQTVRWLNEFAIVPGLGNLFDRLAHNESYYGLVALLNAAPLWNHGGALAGLLLFALTAASVGEARLRSHPAGTWLVLALALGLSLQVYALSFAGTDMAVAMIEIVLFLLLLRILARPPAAGASLADGAALLCLSALLATLKLSAAFFLLTTFLVALPWLARTFARHRMAAATLLTLCLAVGVVHLARGYVLSGVPLYPETFGGAWHLPWAMRIEAVQSEANWIYSWARLPNHPPSEVMGNWRWLGSWIATFPWSGWVLIGSGLVLATAHTCLLWASPRPARDRSLFLLYLPLLGNLPFWFLTAPTLRFLGTIPEITIGLAGYLCIRRLEELGWLRAPDGRWTRTAREGGLAAAALVLLIAAALEPLSFRGWQPAPVAATAVRTTNSGLRVSVPLGGDQCWDTPLPCQGYFLPNVRLLGATMRAGFTRRPPD